MTGLTRTGHHHHHHYPDIRHMDVSGASAYAHLEMCRTLPQLPTKELRGGTRVGARSCPPPATYVVPPRGVDSRAELLLGSSYGGASQREPSLTREQRVLTPLGNYPYGTPTTLGVGGHGMSSASYITNGAAHRQPRTQQLQNFGRVSRIMDARGRGVTGPRSNPQNSRKPSSFQCRPQPLTRPELAEGGCAELSKEREPLDEDDDENVEEEPRPKQESLLDLCKAMEPPRVETPPPPSPPPPPPPEPEPYLPPQSREAGDRLLQISDGLESTDDWFWDGDAASDAEEVDYGGVTNFADDHPDKDVPQELPKG